jgi:hypothetical protein
MAHQLDRVQVYAFAMQMQALAMVFSKIQIGPASSGTAS